MPSDIKTCKPYTPSKPLTDGSRCKGLFIGINYTGTDAELNGCINDVSDMLRLLEKLNYPMQDAVILVDDERFPMNCGMPTHDNIIRGMQWLTQDAKAGDVFFVHYSGHGTQITAEMRDQDEADGQEEAIVPLDYQDNGCILDDTIFTLCARTVPAGARLTAVFDCCHSGSVMDLPYVFTASGDVAGTVTYAPSTNNMVAGDVVMISGCADTQTSADAVGANFKTSSDNPARAGGACTGALQDTIFNNKLNKKFTWAEILMTMRTSLKKRGFDQIPQLSCSKPMKVDTLFELRAPVKEETIAAIAAVSVEVTTTVKPTPVTTDPIVIAAVAPAPAAPAAAASSALPAAALPAASFTPYTFVATYPYTTVATPEAAVPASYHYYDPLLTLAAAANSDPNAGGGDAAALHAAIAAAAEESVMTTDDMYGALPPSTAATVTVVDDADELDEDPADVGGKTLLDLVLEAPQPPIAAIIVAAAALAVDFEPLPPASQQLQVANIKPSQWSFWPDSKKRPPSTYAEFRKKHGEKKGRKGHGWGAGRRWFEAVGVGSYHSVPSKAFNRAHGHAGRVGLPPIAYAVLAGGGKGRVGAPKMEKGFVGARGGRGRGGSGGHKTEYAVPFTLPPFLLQPDFGRAGHGRGGDHRGKGRRELFEQHGVDPKGVRRRGGRPGGKGGRVGIFAFLNYDVPNTPPPPHQYNNNFNKNANKMKSSMAMVATMNSPMRSNGSPMKGFTKGNGKGQQRSLYDRMGSFTIPTDEEDLGELFRTFDSDGNGRIDRGEFVDAMMQYEAQMGLNLSKDALKREFDQADTNHDGRMSFDEFCVYMLRLARQ